MLNQKILKANGTEGSLIAFYSIAFVFFSYCLVKQSLKHTSILEILSILIWIVGCIIQIYLQSNKLINSKSENTPEERDKYQVPTMVQQLIGVIAGFVLGFLLFVLLWGDIDIMKTQPKFLEQLEFKPLRCYFFMAIGIQSIMGTLRSQFDIKKSLLKSILSLFEFMLFVSALIAILIDG
jgi:uncharacterized protein YacL